MKLTEIYRDHTGKWREKNPHMYYENNFFLSYAYVKFEEQVKHYEFPNAPDTKEVVEAHLAYQCKVWSAGEGYSWVTQKNVKFDSNGKVISIAGAEIESRWIWVLADKQETEAECECGVPEPIHGTSCGWANACYTINAETDEEKRWNKEWVKAHPQIHLSRESTDKQETKEEQPKDFQSRVLDWLLKCFGSEIAKDILERNDRFIEESLELAQSLNYSADRAHALVDYVFNRDKGEPFQEVGGVMVTLAALCSATGLNMALDGETEFARINKPEIIEKIRKKQASKPTGSALPILVEQESISNLSDVSQCDAIIKKLNKYNERYNHGLIVQAMKEYGAIKTSSLQQENQKLIQEVERLNGILSKISFFKED